MRKKQHRWTNQRGLTAIGWLLGMLALVTVITLALRLGPHYINYQTILTVMDSLPADQIRGMDNREVRDMLQKRLKINNVRDLPVRDILEFDRSKESTQLNIEYEVREHMFFNVDIVLTFSESRRYQ